MAAVGMPPGMGPIPGGGMGMPSGMAMQPMGMSQMGMPGMPQQMVMMPPEMAAPAPPAPAPAAPEWPQASGGGAPPWRPKRTYGKWSKYPQETARPRPGHPEPQQGAMWEKQQPESQQGAMWEKRQPAAGDPGPGTPWGKPVAEGAAQASKPQAAAAEAQAPGWPKPQVATAEDRAWELQKLKQQAAAAEVGWDRPAAAEAGAWGKKPAATDAGKWFQPSAAADATKWGNKAGDGAKAANWGSQSWGAGGWSTRNAETPAAPSPQPQEAPEHKAAAPPAGRTGGARKAELPAGPSPQPQGGPKQGQAASPAAEPQPHEAAPAARSIFRPQSPERRRAAPEGQSSPKRSRGSVGEQEEQTSNEIAKYLEQAERQALLVHAQERMHHDESSGGEESQAGDGAEEEEEEDEEEDKGGPRDAPGAVAFPPQPPTAPLAPGPSTSPSASSGPKGARPALPPAPHHGQPAPKPLPAAAKRMMRERAQQTPTKQHEAQQQFDPAAAAPLTLKQALAKNQELSDQLARFQGLYEKVSALDVATRGPAVLYGCVSQNASVCVPSAERTVLV